MCRLIANVNQAQIDDGATPLYVASQEGHTDVVAAFVSAGADVNQATGRWSKAAACGQHPGPHRVVGVLVSARANVNLAQTGDGVTPLHSASDQGHADVMAALVLAGANVNQARIDI